MDLGVIPDAPSIGADPGAEGKAWCPRCDSETSYRLEKVEFLGNPVKATAFCLDCGERIQPQARDPQTARRLRSEGRRLRLQAWAALSGMLLLPILIAALVVWLALRLF